MKKFKLFKSLGFATLAVFMGATGVFAFAPLNNAPILPNLSAQASAESQNFDLGLRPDTDPVVYVTESGLEIKKSNGKYSSTTTVTTNRGTSYTQDLTSFYYFTMGTFSGTIYTAKTRTDTYTVSNEPVNWLILARGSGFEFSDNTPAGTSIKTDNPKQEFAITPGGYLPMDMQSIPEDPVDEIPDGCMLVISEKLLGQMYFNSSGALNANLTMDYPYTYYLYTDERKGNRYRYIGNTSTVIDGAQNWTTSGNAGGSLYNYINSLFSKNNSTGAIISNSLGFTQTQANLIVPQQLYTYYSKGSGYNYQETPDTDGGTYYTMFPLAYRTAYSSIYQNFCIEDYLPNPNQRIAVFINSTQSYCWWLRTGLYSHSGVIAAVITSGEYVSSNNNLSYGTENDSHGVRPAFVLKVME